MTEAKCEFSQQVLDMAMVQLRGLYLSQDVPALSWLCAAQKATNAPGITIARDEILSTYAVHGHTPIDGLDDTWRDDDPSTAARRIVGQALVDIVDYRGIRPEIRTLTDAWNAHFNDGAVVQHEEVGDVRVTGCTDDCREAIARLGRQLTGAEERIRSAVALMRSHGAKIDSSRNEELSRLDRLVLSLIAQRNEARAMNQIFQALSDKYASCTETCQSRKPDGACDCGFQSDNPFAGLPGFVEVKVH